MGVEVIGRCTATAFLEFVRQAEQLTAAPPSPVPTDPFRQFVALAVPLVVADIRGHLPAIARRAALAAHWLVRDDLLAVAGFGFVEDAYTELMAWALHPDTDPASAVDRQQAWLESVCLDNRICGELSCVPQPQFITDDGIPDLVLCYDHLTVVVEAKTGSAEHAAPSGNPQTVAYPGAVRDRLKLSSEARVEVIFITPNRRLAANSEAKVTTYAEFALALAGVLDARALHPETRAAYAMLFTHLLTCATPTTTVPVRALIQRVEAWSRAPDWEDDEQIWARRDDLLAAIEILSPERKR